MSVTKERKSSGSHAILVMGVKAGGCPNEKISLTMFLYRSSVVNW
ncbi:MULTISPECIES: hypothetical protein [Nostocaceae]|nr:MULTISPECIES: hypothetical protein [Nostocaceae]